jgi:hypothetical protein
MASVKTCTICFGIRPSASWDKSWRQLPGSAASIPRVQRQGEETGGRAKKPILGRNSGTDLAPIHSNYSLGIVRAASGTTIFELCKSDILQIKHPPNQHLQIKRPPNQHLQVNTSKSIPPNQASSLHPIIVWPFPSRGREFDSSHFLAQDLTI